MDNSRELSAVPSAWRSKSNGSHKPLDPAVRNSIVSYFLAKSRANPRWSERYKFIEAGLLRSLERKNEDKASNGNNLAAMTIVSENYLALALVLCKSFRAHHPGSRFILVLCDKNKHASRMCADHGAELITYEELPLPQKDILRLRYSILELNTAIKPYALRYCLERWAEIEAICYFDPDIQIFSYLSDIWRSLTKPECDVCLTPHLLTPIQDNKKPSVLSILQSGTYNLGFIGLRNSSWTLNFLEWWERMLYLDCVVDIPRGLFTDQKWIDLVPGFAPGCKIIRNPAYNVAYWNLHERTLSTKGSSYYVNEIPLGFFHFSGFNPRTPDRISKHQDRHTLESQAPLSTLFKEYSDNLFSNRFDEFSLTPYAFESLGPIKSNVIFRLVLQYLTRESSDFPSPESNLLQFSLFILAPRFKDQDGGWPMAYKSLHAFRPDVFGYYGITSSSSLNSLSPVSEWLQRDGGLQLNLTDWIAYLNENGISISPVDNLCHKLEKLVSRPEEHKQKSDIRYLENEIYAWLEQNGICKPLLTLLAREMMQSLSKVIAYSCSRHDLITSFSGFSTRNGIESLLDWFEADTSSRPYIQFTNIIQTRALLKQFAPYVIQMIRERNPLASLYSSQGESKCHTAHMAGATSRILAIINLAGLARATTGIGESCRSMHRTLDDIPGARIHSICIPQIFESHESSQVAIPQPQCSDNSFHSNSDASIVVLNADCTQLAKDLLPPKFWSSRLKVGYWAWETPEIPDAHLLGSEIYDTILVPSEYVRNAIQPKLRQEVLLVPHCTDPWMVANFKSHTNKEFAARIENYCKSRYVLGYLYDSKSIAIRKNPSAAINCFKILRLKRPDLGLIVKASSPHIGNYDYERMKQEVQHLGGMWIEDTLSKADVYCLINSIDCIISLHRAEGFGLTLLEAMSLNTLVAATFYSGNVDFMKPEHSLAVPYSSWLLSKEHPPYVAGTLWAEPSIEICCEQLLEAIDNPIKQAELTKKAKAYVDLRYSPQAISKILAKAINLV